MICSGCGAENRPDRKFCLRCGTALATACPSCGAANEPDAGFCGECGRALSGAAATDRVTTDPVGAAPSTAAPASQAATSERRLVSVLFADLVGFTALAEGRDPEETRELLSRYFDVAREVIERYGGVVEKFIGDAVMAVWGAPTAFEDDAERSVRAGLELVDAVRGLGSGIEARAGVLTGEAAVTIGATGEGMVAGDLVNTASRLQSVAPPGAVLVGEATERAASNSITFEQAGEQLLKGKAAPVPAWRAVRVVAERGGRNRSSTLEAPFVGRDEELRLLKDMFHATSRERRARLVSLLGPAGIGKSRLAWEFLKYIDGLVETVWWHDGRSPAHGEGITFWALGEMVRGRCGLMESDDAATTRLRVAEAVERWIPDETERPWIETAILALLGIGEAPSGRDGLFAAWRTFFERISTEGTVVMVFEDLQWADAGLLDFIDHLLEWAKARPIYIVTLARPELVEGRPAWGSGQRNFINLTLEPLTDGAMKDLLEGLVPGLPTRLARAIVTRAEGIPLYAVETIRMLVSEGRLRQEEGVYQPVGELDAIAIPQTLQGLIAARLDALDATDRSLLLDAAVLGQAFTVPGLASVSGLADDAIEPRLRSLVRRELLTLEADPRSPERGQYAFMQSLIREVAYNTLARADRKTRHLAAARYIEALGDDELAGVLAGHYLSAYRSAPEGSEAQALAAQARVALRAAADRAVALGSYRQAAGFLRLALDVTDDPADRAALLERGADAELHEGDFGAAKDLLERAMAWYRSEEDRVGLTRAGTALAIALTADFQPVAAARVLEGLLVDSDELASEPAFVAALTELGRAYGNAQDPRALETVDKALAAADQLDLIPSIVEGLINRALALVYAGRFHEPTVILRGVIPLAAENGLTISQLRAMNNLGSGMLLEDPRGVYELNAEAIELSRRLGIRSWLDSFEEGRAGLSIWLGDWGEADRLIAEVDPDDAGAMNRVNFGENEALILAMRGRHSEATAVLARIGPHRTSMDDPRIAVWERQTASIVAALAGRLDEAFEAGMEGARADVDGSQWSAYWAARAAIWLRDPGRARLAVAAYDGRPERGRMVTIDRQSLHASLRALEGDADAALAGLAEVGRAFRDQDLPIHLGMSLIDLATLLPGDTPEVVSAEAEARRLFEGLGAAGFLERLDAALDLRPTAASAPSTTVRAPVG